ncbi:MAG: ASPIC/UnbV domain-containing protein, partial [Panacibacter sp.]
NSFYLNPGQNTNNWISLALKGTVSNRSAIGARIKITFKENGISRSVYSDVNSGGSFGCSPLRKEIGIGSAQIIDEINIKWPSGKEQVFKNIKPCRFLKIMEDADYVADMQLQKLNYAGNQKDVIECEPISTTVKK